MPKINLPNITTIRRDFPEITFKPHTSFYWSSRDQAIYFNPGALKDPAGLYQLLHELGHALCRHNHYDSGIELLKIETQAWEKAEDIATNYGLVITKKQIEECLDSYRDWLYLRSSCPHCHTVSVETESNQYRCFNCSQKWRVPEDQRRRHYRLKIANSV